MDDGGTPRARTRPWNVRLEQGDCTEVLPRLVEEGVRVDSVVTDPPYHLSTAKRFGGKNSAPAKYGSDGLYQRASSGFMGKEWDGGGVAFDPETWRLVWQILKPGGYLLAFSGTRTYHRMACAIEDAGFEIRDQIGWLYGTGFPKSHDQGGGWGTALKPAWEPIAVARKPLSENTVAANVLRHGTGALNIDGCRIGGAFESATGGMGRKANPVYGEFSDKRPTKPIINTAGRWPANVIHDGSEEVLEAFARFGASKDGVAGARTGGEANGYDGGWGRADAFGGYGGDGTPARFFYSAKADKSDRLGSKHPTVKPVDLISYLCRLVTPPGGTVLDPFAGSGTLAPACRAERFNSILIEREVEYMRDIERRCAEANPSTNWNDGS